jgi:hypothetical protein
MDTLKDLWLRFLSLKLWQKAFVVFIVYLLITSLTGLGGSSDTPKTTSESSSTVQDRSYPVEYLSHADINPATVSVRFSIKNDGTQPITPTCKIKMSDSSGTYSGYDFFDITDPIAAGVTKQVVVQLTITKEGSAYVDKFTGSCTAKTSDTGTSAGKEVVVSNIEDGSWGDDQFELDENKKFPADAGFWYGPTFKVNQPSMTQMDCSWTAFDKNGNVVGTHSFRANTLNGGAVTAYGPDEKWYIDSTQKIVNSVKSYDVKCTL